LHHPSLYRDVLMTDSIPPILPLWFVYRRPVFVVDEYSGMLNRAQSF